MKSSTYHNSLFLKNKYYDWYYRIVERAKTRELESYTEKHHILPRSLGGSNEPENIVSLTAREHFVCHILLTKMTENENRSKMICAVQRFINRNKKQKVIIVTSRQYESCRKLYSKNHPMKNKKISEKVRQTQYAKHGAFAFATPEVFAKQKENSIKKYGVPYAFMIKADEQRKLMNDQILSCPKCGKTGKTLAAMKRWHFDNCRDFIKD